VVCFGEADHRKAARFSNVAAGTFFALPTCHRTMAAIWTANTRTEAIVARPRRRGSIRRQHMLTAALSHARGLAERFGLAYRRANPTRILRWVYRKKDVTVHCELSYGGDWFTLKTQPPFPAGSAGVERFAQVTEAFQRQCAVESALIRDGWSLESHESILTSDSLNS
jgi:hypothetical protein